MAALLVLFDVDGTLFLTPDDLYNQALVGAVHDVYGHELAPESLAGADNAGETATRGLRKILVADGLDAPRVNARLTAWCQRFSRRYLDSLAQADIAHWEVPSEAEEVLARLAGVHRLALLTGNPEPVARERLERLGLSRFFPVGEGAFGCEADDRSELIALALQRAGDWPADRAVLIGDTPRDIEGAHDAGILAVGVASGRFEPASLADADAVVGSLAELPETLARIGGFPPVPPRRR